MGADVSSFPCVQLWVCVVSRRKDSTGTSILGERAVLEFLSQWKRIARLVGGGHRINFLFLDYNDKIKNNNFNKFQKKNDFLNDETSNIYICKYFNLMNLIFETNDCKATGCV